MDIMSSGYYEGFHFFKIDGLFNGISLRSEDGILLGSLVESLVGVSVGSSEVFKYGKLDDILDEI